MNVILRFLKGVGTMVLALVIIALALVVSYWISYGISCLFHMSGNSFLFTFLITLALLIGGIAYAGFDL